MMLYMSGSNKMNNSAEDIKEVERIRKALIGRPLNGMRYKMRDGIAYRWS